MATNHKKSESETYPLRIEKSQLKIAKKIAEAENRTLASLIRHAIACYVSQNGKA